MGPLTHPGAHQIPENDVEKRGELKSSIDIATSGSIASEEHDIPPTPNLLRGRLARWNDKIEGLAGLEARGITRVLPEEKHGGGMLGYFQMFMLWFGIDTAVLNLIVGFLGPLVFNLGWVDCVCIVIFANALSCCGAAYTATLGPQSGNRTMVCWGWNLFSDSSDLVERRNCLADDVRCSPDSRSLFHGVLAIKDNLHPQCHPADRMGYYRGHRCWTNVLSRQRWGHDHRRWLCHWGPLYRLDSDIWHRSHSHIREVRNVLLWMLLKVFGREELGLMT